MRTWVTAGLLALMLAPAGAACPDGREPNVTVIDRYPLARIREAWRKAGLSNAGGLDSAITYLGAGRSCFGGNTCIIWLASDRSASQRRHDLAYEMKNACGRADRQLWMMDQTWLPDPQWRAAR